MTTYEIIGRAIIFLICLCSLSYFLAIKIASWIGSPYPDSSGLYEGLTALALLFVFISIGLLVGIIWLVNIYNRKVK